MRTGTLKSIAALLLTAVGSAFVVGFKTTDDLAIDPNGQTASDTTTGLTASGGSSAASDSVSTGSTSAAPSETAAATAAYADGTWKGTSVSEPWGGFQVAVVVSDGTITGVTVIKAPSDRRSTWINSQAVPLLTESVLASQGTSIDMVSGATWTSDSYATSLQSALDKAAQAT